MRVSRAEARYILMMIVVIMTVPFAWGCTTMNHSYDLGMNFSGLKTYNWNPPPMLARQNPLVDSNVQFIADQILDKKGFNKSSEKLDFMISIYYEYDISSYYYPYNYDLKMLSLNIYGVENKKLIWQGTKLGTISTDVSSSDLKKAVEEILYKFPPK